MQKLWQWLIQRRWVVQLISTLTLNSYVTQNITRGLPCPALNCYACPAAAGACPIGAIQTQVGLGQVPAYVLGAMGVVGALVGRACCGWVCPFGWLQDLLYKIPVPKWRWPNRFTWLRYVVLAGTVFAMPALVHQPVFCRFCPAGMLEGGIPQILLLADLRALIGTLYWIKLTILGVFLGWMAVTRRPFCRWICPLGALWSPFNAVSTWRLQVDQESCIQCNRCQEVCPVDIRVYEMPNDGQCIRCLACQDVCPTSCISVASLKKN